MRGSQLRFATGMVAAAFSAMVSPVLMVLVSGIGICGGPPLGPGLVGVSMLLAAGLSSLAGCLLQSRWWIGSITFSWALYLCLAINLIAMEWKRAAVAAACIATSVLAARIGAKIGLESAASL